MRLFNQDIQSLLNKSIQTFMYLQILSLLLINCLLTHHLTYHSCPHHHNMPTLMLKIPQNLLSCNTKSFTNSTTINPHNTDLVKLPADPMVEASVKQLTSLRGYVCESAGAIGSTQGIHM